MPSLTDYGTVGRVARPAAELVVHYSFTIHEHNTDRTTEVTEPGGREGRTLVIPDTGRHFNSASDYPPELPDAAGMSEWAYKFDRIATGVITVVFRLPYFEASTLTGSVLLLVTILGTPGPCRDGGTAPPRIADTDGRNSYVGGTLPPGVPTRVEAGSLVTRDGTVVV